MTRNGPQPPRGESEHPQGAPAQAHAAARASMQRQLPKRFYKAVTHAPADGQGFAIKLDGRAVRTPAKHLLQLPTAALAAAVAAEWAAQGERIDPATMPLTRLVNSALDGVAVHSAEVAADIVKFAASDLTCYRAEAPRELVQRQHERWDPVLEWAANRLGHRFAVGQGVIPLRQSKAALASLAEAIRPLSPLALAALHTMTTLTGSALLAFAHFERHISAHEAWCAAHVDEDWQISQWGEDAEAHARRAHRWADMQAASRLLTLLDA